MIDAGHEVRKWSSGYGIFFQEKRMLSESAKEIFKKLDLSLPSIAIKYMPVQPQGIERSDKKLAFCQFVKEAQDTGTTFYITADNDACYGKMALGMIPKPPVTASGQAGFDFGIYRTPSACMKLYQNLPVLVPGTINYVVFSPVSVCDFDPDLIIAFADIPKAEILMRATSYISGDLWESVSSPVISCSWVYAYPIISGKVNHITTGFYHGLRRRKVYESGLRIISIPFNKINEVVLALQEMDWVPIAFREDEESKDELKRRVEHWQEMAREMDCECSLH
jgi:uncharacterized protein (DUF169 family)